MALYRHVPSKAHLIAAMTDAAYGSQPIPTGRRRSWRGEVEPWVIALLRVYKLHPWLITTPTTTAPIGPNALTWIEALLRPLARAGLSSRDLLATATFVSSAVRDLARIGSELDPAAAGEAAITGMATDHEPAGRSRMRLTRILCCLTRRSAGFRSSSMLSITCCVHDFEDRIDRHPGIFELVQQLGMGRSVYDTMSTNP
jgi:AcrR family transcriptional regulator